MAAVAGMASLERVVPVDRYHDLVATLRPLRHGDFDRTIRFFGGTAWRATRTPDGPATARYTPASHGRAVEVEAWGPGAGYVIHHADELLGLTDDLTGWADLVVAHPELERIWRRHPGIRIPRSRSMYEAMAAAVLEQRVTSIEAVRAWQRLTDRWGEPAPGPDVPELRLPAAPEVVAEIPYHALHPLGVERRRADTLRRVARAATRLEETVDLSRRDAYRRMRAIPGVGPWTEAEVGRVALGDADAVSVGDYHLPELVCWVLAGERSGTDARMLELLAPYAPHRGRVCRLVEMSRLYPPRRAPRARLSNIASR